MKQTIFVIVTITLILSACTSPAIIAPTETAVMTATPALPTQTQTPLPPTEIPATTTPDMVEVQQGVEWTTVENIQDCAKNPLNDQNMEPGGRVDQYLAQRKPELMEEIDWDIIKDEYPFTFYSQALVYKSGEFSGEKFVNPELNPSVPDTNPFDRDIDAFGLYTAGNGRKYCFIQQ